MSLKQNRLVLKLREVSQNKSVNVQEDLLEDLCTIVTDNNRFSTAVDEELMSAAGIDSLAEWQKCVFILIDEMHIKENLVYDKHSGSVIGFTNVGDINNELLSFEQEFEQGISQPDKPLAKTILTFMVRGIFTSLKFHYAHFPCKNLTGELMFDPFWEAVYRLETCGFKVLGVTFDGAAVNHPPHLIKTVRNCWASKNRTLWCKGEYVSWSHLYSLYKNDSGKGSGLSLIPKLKFEHLNLTSFSKMQVDLAAQLRGEDDPKVLEWLKCRNEKYTCSESQDEMLQIMALSILRDLVHRIKSSVFYSIMTDETADASNREQIVIVIRHVSDDLVPHEEFTGLAKVPSIDANTVTETTEDSLLRVKKGVASQISMGDTVKQSKLMRDALNTTHEISKLLKYSPKRDSLIECLKQSIAPETQGFRTLCPTRWTVRAASLKSVIDNYTVLQELWDECDTNDSDIRARILGVSAQMGTFNYLFGVMLGYEILRHTDNLSKALQQEALTASEGQELGKLAIECLQKMRNDIKFDHFWEKVEAVRINVDVVEPAVPRKRKVPERFQVGNGEYSFPVTVKEVYRP
eukprot:Em0001g3599a